MSNRERRGYDAVVVGAGPNGLAAAITMARAGRSVLVLEARDTVGGGCRSAQLTLPGFTHDVCSAIHPLGPASPFMRSLPLTEHGLEWVQPSAPLAHPLDDGTAVVLERSVGATALKVGRDAASYRRLVGPVVRDWPRLSRDVLGPLRIPRHPVALARFGLKALLPALLLSRAAFKGERARALFAGMAAHSMLPLERPPSASFGLVLAALGHVVGWPVARGGSQRIVDAMASYLRSLGGEITTGRRVGSLDDLPPAKSVLFDLTPRQIVRIAGERLPGGYRRQLGRYRYGPGVFKVDWALEGPVPWKAAECLRASTVHLGGTLEEIAEAERAVWRGEHPERPFVLVGQQSLFDRTRAPEGKHTLWAYCHVPHGSTRDMTGRIEAQLERFAPGFGERVLARHTMSAAQMQRYNANYIGGDINGGVQDLLQLFTRPTLSLVPYSTPAEGIYICSSSTPPGGGVHGMCGYHAASVALRDLR
ncbi:MAG TPA: NAD(P)/FAD-dependent oxidoreductase [Chloroflexia bacterium]|nr:NAD(P)/FAD-dependent oxidoreductase [Chloroflexia bacterium]